MYHIVKPISEWQYHDCKPVRHARPKDSGHGGEPMFDIHDVKPVSRRGDDFLHDLHYEMRRREYGDISNRERGNHMRDSMRYAAQAPWHGVDWASEIKPEKKEMITQSKNVQLAEALLDNFHTVEARVADSLSEPKLYKVPKDLVLVKGDLLLIPYGSGFKVAEITEVHGRAKNPEEAKLKWIVQVVDTTDYDLLVAQDEKAVETILELEKRKTRRELVNELTGDLTAEETLALSADLGVDVCESPE